VDESDAWRLALRKVVELGSVRPEIQTAFVPIWVRHKALPRAVRDRRVMADALRLLMPGRYAGPALTLFRGADSIERRHHRYGFAWSTDLPIARNFAQQRAHPALGMEGVVLRTLAPPNAVLLVRLPGDSFDEGEVVVDPFRLGKIEIVERVTDCQGVCCRGYYQASR
jgi:hypothetical protein